MNTHTHEKKVLLETLYWFNQIRNDIISFYICLSNYDEREKKNDGQTWTHAHYMYYTK